MSKIAQNLILACAPCAIWVLLPNTALAADQVPVFKIEEIVITAQKREQSVLDVPLSISAIGGSQMNRTFSRAVNDIIEFVPGMSGSSFGGRDVRHISIRGVTTEDYGIGTDGSLGIYVDNVYIGRTIGAGIESFDVERIEIVRGPQGTLFGRNSTAGAIHTINNKPSDKTEGNVSATIGNQKYRDADAVINIPLVENRLAVRVAGAYRKLGDLAKNATGDIGVGGGKSGGVRATLGYTDDNTTAYLTGELQWSRYRPHPGVNIRELDPEISVDPFGPVASDIVKDIKSNQDSYIVSLHVEHDLSDSLSLTSTTAARGFTQVFLNDVDGGPIAFNHVGIDAEQDTFSQELRLNGKTGNLDWFVGGSLFYERISSEQTYSRNEFEACDALELIGVIDTENDGTTCADLRAFNLLEDEYITEISDAKGRYWSSSIFADAVWAATNRLNFTAGLRFTRDKKTYDLNIPTLETTLGNLAAAPTDGWQTQRESWTALQPRFAIDYAVSDTVRAYISASKGYQSGGFNQTGLNLPFSPEYVWSYEVGLKGTSADKRATFELAAYLYDRKDLQVLVAKNGYDVTQNAGKVRGIGYEMQLKYLVTESFELSGSLSWIPQAKFKNFNLGPENNFTGNRMPRAPKLTAHIAADWYMQIHDDWALAFQTSLSYRSSSFLTNDNRIEYSAKSFALVNGRITLVKEDGLFDISLFVRNAFNKRFIENLDDVVPGLIDVATPNQGRIFGVNAGFHF